MVKRTFDLTLVIFSSPFWGLLLGFIAFLVRIRLGAPVFFRQPRAGRGGRSFEVVKFRSMTDARDAQGVLLPDEQRITAFGRWLRETSLDEIPEVLNILKGDMSLVGPRPLLLRYVNRYTAEQSRRLEVAPGLTGWAQINGRNCLNWESRFALDVWYIDHRSLWLDICILARTVGKVLLREGVSAQGQATMPEFMGSFSPSDGLGDRISNPSDCSRFRDPRD
jgi:sugar transferase EpsL